MTDLGKKVKELRNKQELSQYKLSYEADIDRSQVIGIEKGEINATISTIAALADALKVKPKDLLDF